MDADDAGWWAACLRCWHRSQLLDRPRRRLARLNPAWRRALQRRLPASQPQPWAYDLQI